MRFLLVLGPIAAIALAFSGGHAFDRNPIVAGPSAGTIVVSTMRDADMIEVARGEAIVESDGVVSNEVRSDLVEVSAFLMDRTPVTVAQFATFVHEAGFVTDAEHAGFAGVMDSRAGAWVPVAGAFWRRPFGPSGSIAHGDHPVTQVSWRDADAFCKTYNARLPTESEWERAAALGQTADGRIFTSGSQVEQNGKFLANVWQGVFPILNTAEDGYVFTSPVGAFGETPAGLTDMAGNVWQWTGSWREESGSGPKQRGEKIQRGGSFLCDPGFCQGFRVTARNYSTPETSLMHVGFRCAAAPERWTPKMGRVRAHSSEMRTDVAQRGGR